jgi:cell shape-determining protein MreC
MSAPVKEKKAAGNGCTDDLQLEHLPANTDIRVGDVLVTSGLGFWRHRQQVTEQISH